MTDSMKANYGGNLEPVVLLLDDGTGRAFPLVLPLPVSSDHKSYTLLNGATSTGTQTLAPDTYGLSFPTNFNGDTLTLTFSDAGGSTTVLNYTSAPATPPVFTVFAGTTAVATAAGAGTPTGTLKINGGPPSMWATSPMPVIATTVAVTGADVSVASLSAGMAAGTTAVLGANANRRSLTVTAGTVDIQVHYTTDGLSAYKIVYAGTTSILSGADIENGAIYVRGMTTGDRLRMREGQ